MKDSQSIGRFQWKILFYAKLKLILSILSALFIPLFFSATSVHKALWNIDTFMVIPVIILFAELYYLELYYGTSDAPDEEIDQPPPTTDEEPPETAMPPLRHGSCFCFGLCGSSPGFLEELHVYVLTAAFRTSHDATSVNHRAGHPQSRGAASIPQHSVCERC